MTRKVSLRACPYCGSLDTHPALLFGGPIPWIDHNDGGYQCRHCGRTAVPLDFDSVEDLKTFQKSIVSKATDENDHFLHVPIMPIDTFSLFRIPYIDLPIAQVANVVEVEWENGYTIKGRKERFSRYWSAVHSPRYSAKEISLLDLSGIKDGRPNFDVLKTLIKSKYRVWLDLGVRDIEDVFDAFAMDVSRTIIGTMTAPSVELFAEAFDLSDRVVPCLYYDGKVLWPSRSSGPSDLLQAIATLKDIGFEEIGVLDLRRIGRGKGIDQSLLGVLSEQEVGIIMGGGVTELEATALRTAGLVGAFMDPFTPVIGDLIVEEERELPSEGPSPVTRAASSGHGAPSD
ncbi:MAG: HisA/HisF-related TIM barrel protein [Methanomassiliicoccus sp.]|nr:HisA/HisF-related TIM barrel protein [Methanomassiliicoccus sp.]